MLCGGTPTATTWPRPPATAACGCGMWALGRACASCWACEARRPAWRSAPTAARCEGCFAIGLGMLGRARRPGCIAISLGILGGVQQTECAHKQLGPDLGMGCSTPGLAWRPAQASCLAPGSFCVGVDQPAGGVTCARSSLQEELVGGSVSLWPLWVRGGTHLYGPARTCVMLCVFCTRLRSDPRLCASASNGHMCTGNGAPARGQCSTALVFMPGTRACVLHRWLRAGRMEASACGTLAPPSAWRTCVATPALCGPWRTVEATERSSRLVRVCV